VATGTIVAGFLRTQEHRIPETGDTKPREANRLNACIVNGIDQK